MEKYVISAELDIVAEDQDTVIARENIEEFRESLDADLRGMGKQTEWVDSSEIRDDLAYQINKTRLPVISLDDRYVKSAEAFVGISRGVDDELNDVGYVPRIGYPSISDQIDAIQVGGLEAVIADDVIFSGEMLVWLIEELMRRRNIKVTGVIGGIAIGEGVKRLNDLGVLVEAARSFASVEDEICERDFAALYGSGRRNDMSNSNVLYFDQVNGKPEKWASIPGDAAKEFAASSFDRSARILKPGTKMEALGRFMGLKNGDAQTVLREAATRYK